MPIRDLKEYANVVIYSAAILMIISIILPHASHFIKPEQSHVLWLWGLIAEVNWLSSPMGYREDISFYFNSNPIVFGIGLLLGIVLLLISIKNILIARNFRRDLNEKYINPWYNVFYGIIPILLMISWIIFIEVIYAEIGFLGNYDFWEYFVPNFGVYGFIVGSSICTVGHILQKYL
ncbi:MAG: hypothetical protein ACFFG0_30035 [Candidatus Thorarchaeota archaeon]